VTPTPSATILSLTVQANPSRVWAGLPVEYTLILVNQSARAYVEAHYGLPILHDMSEGEFPRLMAAIRSVDSGPDNRLVMAPQETL
jgi:hypothetical protein